MHKECGQQLASMTDPMKERFELRANTSDLQQWREAAMAAGCGSLGEWVRRLLREEAQRSTANGMQDRELRRTLLDAGERHQPVFGKTVLENGVRIVTEALPGVRSIAIGVIVDCGSKDESAEQSGIAHLCEHMLFQGPALGTQCRLPGKSIVPVGRWADSQAATTLVISRQFWTTTVSTRSICS